MCLREPLSRDRLRYSFFVNNLSQPEKGVNVYWVDIVSQPFKELKMTSVPTIFLILESQKRAER